MTTSGCSKKKKKQKNTLRAITDNADSKRDKKLGPNLNYFFMKPQVNKLLSLLSVTKKQKQKRGNQSLCYKKKIEISQI